MSSKNNYMHYCEAELLSGSCLNVKVYTKYYGNLKLYGKIAAQSFDLLRLS